jgi:hypothetical protein
MDVMSINNVVATIDLKPIVDHYESEIQSDRLESHSVYDQFFHFSN